MANNGSPLRCYGSWRKRARPSPGWTNRGKKVSLSTNAPAKPFRDVRLGPNDIILDHRPDGVIYAKSPHPLGPYPTKLTERLDYWAKQAPDRTFMAQRGPDGNWRRLSYADASRQARCIGQALVNRGLSPERPIAVLSANDLEHALIGFGALYAGIPYAPI